MDRAMRVRNGDLKGRLKVVLGFGAPNVYDVQGKKIRIKNPNCRHGAPERSEYDRKSR